MMDLFTQFGTAFRDHVDGMCFGVGMFCFAKMFIYTVLKRLVKLFSYKFHTTCYIAAVQFTALYYLYNYADDAYLWAMDNIPYFIPEIFFFCLSWYVLLHEFWTIFGLRNGEWMFWKDNATWFGLRWTLLFPTERMTGQPYNYWLGLEEKYCDYVEQDYQAPPSSSSDNYLEKLDREVAKRIYDDTWAYQYHK